MEVGPEVKEATRVCLQKFAEGIMLGYRKRIFEAIDAKIQSIEDKVAITGEVNSYINGLNAVKTIIRKLDRFE